MLKTLHIPARVGLLALAFSAFGLAEDRFVIKVDGDVNFVASRNHLTVVKSLKGSGYGVHVVTGPKGVDAQHVLQG